MNPYPVGIGMTHVSEGTNAASDVVRTGPARCASPDVVTTLQICHNICDNIINLIYKYSRGFFL